MAPTLYVVPGSPPVRAVLLTAESIGLNLDLKEIDISKGEHKTPEYLKLNPQHTVPTLVEEDGFTLWDSHAVAVYLVSKYAEDDSLYPTDLKKRAVVDQRLHFDSGVAWAQFLTILRPLIYHGKKTLDEEQVEGVHETYSFVEAFLEGKEWIAGDSLTIADYSLISTLTSINVVIKIDDVKYPRLSTWLKKVESLPEYESSKGGLEDFTAYITGLLS